MSTVLLGLSGVDYVIRPGATRRRGRGLGILIAALVGLASPSRTSAQNPIASKVVGSDVAATNRAHSATLGEGVRQLQSGRLEIVDSATRITFSTNQLAFARDPNIPKPKSGILCSGVADRGKVRDNLDLLRKTPNLADLVDEALNLELGRLKSSTACVDTVRAERHALARLLNAQQNGHTNPERWFVGGQAGLTLFGDGELGSVMRASARATYFIPISALRRWQLPVVSNLADLSATKDDEIEGKLKKVLTTSDGAFFAIEPTWDPVFRSAFGDMRLQPFLSIGGQVNRFRALEDTTTTVTFGQGRIGAGVNLEIGRRSSGQSVLFVSSRIVEAVFNKSDHEKVFGESRGSRAMIENYALVPIGGSTALLIESTMGQGAAPVVRVGFWSQAVAQKPKAGNGTGTPSASDR